MGTPTLSKVLVSCKGLGLLEEQPTAGSGAVQAEGKPRASSVPEKGQGLRDWGAHDKGHRSQREGAPTSQLGDNLSIRKMVKTG